MHCKLIKHGLAISYDHAIKPCCESRCDNQWKDQHNISSTDLSTWHSSYPVIALQKQFDNDTWPENCSFCAHSEKTGTHDSIRRYANQSYANYSGDDITLEIRPGSACNFACQTCWPEASSRVAYFYQQGNLIDTVDSRNINDFSFLEPIAHRIRSVVLLGGEPFYDKNCLKFLDWAAKNLTLPITMFTNASIIDWELLSQFTEPVTLSISIDAIGKAAEYIRFGTVWEDVLNNYKLAQKTSNINLRVNVTFSAFNSMYIEPVINFLLEEWPEVVTFGHAWQRHFKVAVIPISKRKEVIDSVSSAAIQVMKSCIDKDQKYNAINSLKGIIHNLRTLPHDEQGLEMLTNFIKTMDQLKKIRIDDYCPLTANTLLL